MVRARTRPAANPAAKRIRELRKRADLSCRRLSELAGLSKGHVYVIETTPTFEATARVLRAIGQVLGGASIDWLYAGTGEPPSDEAIADGVRRATARWERAHKRVA